MFYLFLAVLGVLVLFFIYRKNPQLSSNNALYVSKKVLTSPEQVLYWRLKEVVPEPFVLLSQVSFSAFISTRGGTKDERNLFFGSCTVAC